MDYMSSNMTSCKKDLIWLSLFAFIVYFAGNWLLPITDPVESNYTLTAKEMIETGDWVSPRIYGNFWYDKPVFFYWELIAAFSLFGISDFSARLFPTCFSILAVIMTYLFGRKLYGERKAFCGTLIMASSFGFWYLSKAVITDMSLFVFSNALLIFFYIGYTEQKRSLYYLCWICGALATLTKGPVGLLLPGLVIVLFLCIRRDFSEILRLKLITGFLLFFAIGGPWYYQMYQLHGMDFIGGFLGTHNVLRATVSEHPRDNVWWYYIMIFAASFFPWVFSLVKARTPIFTKKFWKEMPQDKVFLLVWAFTVIGCYQMAATKYPTYTFPSVLPIALLWGCWAVEREALVKKVAIGMAVFFIGMSCTAVPWYIRDHVSGVTVASQLDDTVGKDDLLVSYGNYRTSSVYYSGHTIYRLDTLAGIEDSKPKAMSWDIKNVMPFYPIEELPKNKPIYVMVDKNRLDNFQRDFSADKYDCEVLKENNNTQLVRMYVK